MEPSGENSTATRSTVSTVNSASDSQVVVSYSFKWSLLEKEREIAEAGAYRGTYELTSQEKVQRHTVLVGLRPLLAVAVDKLVVAAAAVAASGTSGQF